jgi:arylsulfatase A-like enzyme
VARRGEAERTITCLCSDHGEVHIHSMSQRRRACSACCARSRRPHSSAGAGQMLADRGATAKSKPWMSAMSVPLICAGPTVARNAVVSWPVSTMDLAATFIQLAGGHPAQCVQ